MTSAAPPRPRARSPRRLDPETTTPTRSGDARRSRATAVGRSNRRAERDTDERGDERRAARARRGRGGRGTTAGAVRAAHASRMSTPKIWITPTTAATALQATSATSTISRSRAARSRSGTASASSPYSANFAASHGVRGRRRSRRPRSADRGSTAPTIADTARLRARRPAGPEGHEALPEPATAAVIATASTAKSERTTCAEAEPACTVKPGWKSTWRKRIGRQTARTADAGRENEAVPAPDPLREGVRTATGGHYTGCRLTAWPLENPNHVEALCRRSVLNGALRRPRSPQ